MTNSPLLRPPWEKNANTNMNGTLRGALNFGPWGDSTTSQSSYNSDQLANSDGRRERGYPQVYTSDISPLARQQTTSAC